MSLAPLIDVANRHSDLRATHARSTLPSAMLDFISGAAVNPKRVVKFDTAAGTVIQAAADTDAFIGVALNDLVSVAGQEIPVGVSGVVQVEAGAAITQGARLSSDSVGRALTAASGDAAWGKALQSASAAGSVITAVIASGTVLA